MKIQETYKPKISYFIWPAYFALSLVFMAIVFWLVIIKANSVIETNIIPYIAFMLILIVFGLIYVSFRYKFAPQNLFLAIVIPAGLFFLFFILPTDEPDEVWHIFRALTIFENDGSSMMIPHDADYNFAVHPISYADFFNLLTSTTDWESTIECAKEMNSYLPVQYFVSGTMMQVAKFLGANYWMAIYAGRLANFVMYVCAGYLILKIIPFGKNAILVFLLNPILIQQEASISADAVCNICAFFYILFLIKAYLEKEKRKQNIILMLIFAFLLCRCKVGGYAPLCLLMLIFIFKLDSRKKRTIAIISALLIISVGYIYIVYAYNGSLVPEARQLMRNPEDLATVLVNTAERYGLSIIIQYNGAFLGALDIYVAKKFYLVYFILQAIVLIIPARYSGKKFENKDKALITLVCIIEIFAIFMTQVWWSQQKGEFDAIQGVQGRYLIPVVFIMLFCFCRIKKSGSVHSRHNLTSNFINNINKKIPDRLAYTMESYGLEIIIVVVMGYIYLGDTLAILHHFGV